MACTILPLILFSVGTELLSNKFGSALLLNEVRALEKATAIFRRNFGMIDEVYGSRGKLSNNPTYKSDDALQGLISDSAISAKSRLCRLFQNDAKFCLRISVALDVTIAHEKCPEEEDLPSALRA